jgi:hypothetical protein
LARPNDISQQNWPEIIEHNNISQQNANNIWQQQYFTTKNPPLKIPQTNTMPTICPKTANIDVWRYIAINIAHLCSSARCYIRPLENQLSSVLLLRQNCCRTSGAFAPLLSGPRKKFL